MARTGRAFPSTPIILHGRIVPAAPTTTRPVGVTFVGQVENQREGRLRRDTTLIVINQSRIAAAPIPTNRPLQPVVVLADHTRLPRSPLDRVTVNRGVVAPAAPPPSPRIIQPLVQQARTHRPSSAKVLVLRPPTVAIVRPPAPLIAGFSAERRPAPRYRSHVTILHGQFVPAPAAVTKPVQIVALTRLPNARRGRAQVLIQHGRVFVAPSGAGPPITCETNATLATAGRTTIRGMESTTVTLATAQTTINPVPSLTQTTEPPSRTGADCG